MTLQQFNQQSPEAARAQLYACCGSDTWTDEMMKQFPFASEQQLLHEATSIWYDACSHDDWLQAFAQHPKIGDIKSLEEKFASTSHLTSSEQAGVAAASTPVVESLAKANKGYDVKFRFIFIVCATGKSAEEMLRLMNDRLRNTYRDELQIAMGEQMKITMLRLKKLLDEADWSFMKPGQLTTHVLDTSIGKPGCGITIRLQQVTANGWETIAQGITNSDGRISDLLPSVRVLPVGTYKMIFETGPYYEHMQVQGFYPVVELQFSVSDDQHYHVPLLLNPFGFSTYRGS